MKKGLVLGIILVSLIFVFGCGVDEGVEDNENMYKRLDFFKGDLSLNTLPVLNKEVELSFTFSRENINQFNSSSPLIVLHIPEGISINGPTRWEGVEGTEVTTNIIVKKVGEYKIKVYIETIYPAKVGFSAHKELSEYFLCFKTTQSLAEIINCGEITERVKVEKIG